MLNVKFYMSDLHACGFVRGEVPAAGINKTNKAVRVDCKMEMIYSDIPNTDIMVYQRMHDEGIVNRMNGLKSFGIKPVYDVDDDMFNMPVEFQKPYEFYRDPKVRAGMEACMRASEAIICSTNELKCAIESRLGNSIPLYVVENCIDTDMWADAYLLRQTKEATDKVVIGWHASGSHMIDAPIITDAILYIMEKYPNVSLKFMGWIGFDSFQHGVLKKFKDRISVDSWVQIHDLPYVVSNFDIGLAPLQDNLFNRAKSHQKALEYGSVGVAVVASSMPCYATILGEGRGITCVSTADWIAALERLIENPELRRTMGAKLRKHVIDNYDNKVFAKKWIETYNRILNQ